MRPVVNAAKLRRLMGEQIADVRKERNVDRGAMARLIERREDTLRRVELGEELPDHELLYLLAWALRCDVGDLYPDVPEVVEGA